MPNKDANSPEELLQTALAAAGVNESASVLLLVSGAPPEHASEYAYLPPGGETGNLEARVLYDARECLDEFSTLHRFGV